MFVLGLLIIIALFIFRATYKISPEDRRIQDKLKVRTFGTLGAAALAAIMIIGSLLRIVPPGSVGVQVLFGRYSRTPRSVKGSTSSIRLSISRS